MCSPRHKLQLLVQLMFLRLTVAGDAHERVDRQDGVDQGLGLVPLEAPRVVAVLPEVPRLEQGPVDEAQPVHVGREPSGLQVGVPVADHEGQASLRQGGDRADEEHDLGHGDRGNALPGLDVEEHRRPRREVEGHVVGEGPAGSHQDATLRPLLDEVWTPDGPEARVEPGTAAAADAVRQDPGHVGDMRDPEDQGLLAVDQGRAHGSEGPLATSGLLDSGGMIVNFRVSSSLVKG